MHADQVRPGSAVSSVAPFVSSFSEEISRITKQIQSLIVNHPVIVGEFCENSELARLQEMINTLAFHLTEANELYQALAEGKLDTEPPGRGNYLASYGKSIQANLRHLAWQARQIARGDYGHRVSFMGTFSRVFDDIVEQLKKREQNMSAQMKKDRETVQLLTAVTDEIADWLVILDPEKNSIIYANESARSAFFNEDLSAAGCRRECLLWESINMQVQSGVGRSDVVRCCSKDKTYLIKSHNVERNGKKAFACLLTDITQIQEQRSELENYAYRDELTQVYNRRYCINRLKDLIESSVEFSVCFLDIDRLKYVNDTYGHYAGDDYIKTVAAILSQSIRKNDCLCRIGGDEFVVLLPHCSYRNASQRMENFERSIGKCEKEYPLSVSYGVMCIPPAAGLLPEKILNEADSRMYALKRKKMY